MVNKEVIKTAIMDKEEELKEKLREEKIIDRELKIGTLARDVASIITGVRRCGKSIFAFLLTKNKNSAYVNFEDERLNIEAKDLNVVLEAIYELKGKPEFIVFDEIQNVEGWERFVARILARKRVIITGSNARLLSKELATFLTGRHIDYELFPFSFREFLVFKNFKPNIYLTKDIAKVRRFLQEYMEFGGFPLAYRYSTRFISETYKDIIERDVIQRYKIKYIKLLKDLALYYISNSSSLISFNNLRKLYKVKSVETIKNYSEYLSNAYLLFFVQKFSFKLKEQEISPKKVYCIDNGIITTMAFRLSENLGRLMENLVAIELLRRKSYWHNNLEIFYWKDYQQREVDFIVKEPLRIKQLVQVTYASARDEIDQREIKSLLKASEIFKKHRPELLVITWDYENEEKIKNRKIKFLPLWKWLLEIK